MKPRAFNPFLIAATAAVLAISSVHAASGTWNGTSGDWGTTGTWSGGTIADGVDSTANFTGVNITAGQTINLEAARTIGNITFTDLTTSSNNLTISGANILTLDRATGVPIIDVTQSNRTLSISSQISGADGLQKNGTGALSLSGANDYTGTTVIGNGILAISNNAALGATSGNTTITATGANTGPQLQLSNNINSAENITLTGNSDASQYNSVISNTSGTNTLSGNITLASPTGTGIRLGSADGELILAGTVSQTGTTKNLVLQALTGAAITVNNAIANNNGALNILGAGAAGTGTVILKTASTAIGATLVAENGTLKLGVTNALKTTAALTLGVNYGSGGFAGCDYGTFDLAGFNQTVSALIGTKSALAGTIGADSTRVVTNSAASGTSVLTVGNGTGVFNGVIKDGPSAAVALTKTGNGTQTLVGDSNYSGVTTISGGTLSITHSNALGSTAGNTSIAATGSNTGGQLALSNGINSLENITISGTTETGSYYGAIVSTTGTNTLSGNITLTSPANGIRFTSSAGSLTFAGNISQTGASRDFIFQAQATSTITVKNPIANNGGRLVIYSYQSVNNSVTLQGVNGVGGIGDTLISQSGTLKLGVSEALNTSGNLDLGVGTTDAGTFDLAGFNQTVNALNGVGTTASNSSRKVTNSAAGTGTNTLTVGNGNSAGTFNGVIVDGTTAKVALVKTGSGNETLNGTNTYIGGTRIDNGTLTLGHATNTLLSTGAVNVNGGTLALGTNTDSVGAVTLTSGNITGSGAGTLTGTAYDVRSGTVTAKLAGSSVVLTKTTAGTVTLSGGNTYSGATLVNLGTLTVSSTGTVNSSSGVTIGTAATAAAAEFNYNNSTTALSQGVSFASNSTGGTLSGTGTITPAVIITSGNRQTAGSAVTLTNTTASLGTQTFSTSIDYQAGSIFEWNLTANTTSSEGTRGTSYDAVNTPSLLNTGADAIFRVVLDSSQNFSEGFWNSGRQWTDIFKNGGTALDIQSIFGTGANVQYYNSSGEIANVTTTQGYFTISGTNLNWTAVPEPSSALAGLLLGAGLLRRRRDVKF